MDQHRKGRMWVGLTIPVGAASVLGRRPGGASGTWRRAPG